MCVLAVAGAGVTGLARASLAGARADRVADAAALAGARVLQERADDLLPRHDPVRRRTVPPLLTRSALERLASDAARRAASAQGGTVESLSFEAAPRRPGPTSLRVTVGLREAALPAWLGHRRRAAAATATARAGWQVAAVPAVAGAPRPADLAGFAGP